MKRLFTFVLGLALLIAASAWLADKPGTARIVWHGTVIETSASFLALAVFGFGWGLFLLFRFWHLLRHGPTIWRLNRTIRKQTEGQDDLTFGFAALAAGNATEAGRLACRARSKLGATPATRLLQAQAAQMAGDHDTARELFESLTEDSGNAILGYRGLISEAWRQKEWTALERLLDQASRAYPNAPWVRQARFNFLAHQGRWRDATLLSLKTPPRLVAEESRLQRAAAFIALSQQEVRQGHKDEALEAAEKALRETPHGLPALIHLVAQQMEAGHKRAARHLIEKNWERFPHPQLAKTYTQDDTPLDAYKKIEELCHTDTTDPAHLHTLAEAALEAHLWGEARRHLMTLLKQGQATQGAYRLLAALEKNENHNESAAMEWLAKAVDAPADPVWLCQACGGTHEAWHALCSYCGGFATLDWHSPGVARGDTLATQNLLPPA